MKYESSSDVKKALSVASRMHTGESVWRGGYEIAETIRVLAEEVRALTYKVNNPNSNTDSHYYYTYEFVAHGEIDREFVQASTDAGAESLARQRCQMNHHQFVRMIKVYRS